MLIDTMDVQTMLSASSGAPRVESTDPAAAAWQRMRRYHELTGLRFLCVKAATGEIISRTDPETLELMPPDLTSELAAGSESRVVLLRCGLICGVLPLPDVDRQRTVAVTYLVEGTSVPDEVVMAAAEAGWPQARLNRWLARQSGASAEMLTPLFENVLKVIDFETRNRALESEIEHLDAHLETTYEQISLLHTLAQNLQISRSPAEIAEMCLDRVHFLIHAEGSLVWMQEKEGSPHFLVRGETPLDELGLARLVCRFENHDWSRPVVKNRIEGTLLGADFPGLRNLVIVPIAEGTNRSGWFLSCNMLDGKEFGTVEASLLNSVATILGTHLRNIELYEEHNELLLGFVRSLVETLDAKDPYTRGHSERVALVARRLGEEFHLPEKDLHDIYVSGLLHDIGKIGVDDRILQNPGKLTPEEFKSIQRHPMIGFSILHGLRNLCAVLPGVRSHHEMYNGGGYPDGLAGEAIPLMARILAVADAYDAMGSNRPYRAGLPLEKIEEIFRQGAGTQWDPKVIDAYFAVRDDIRQICEDYSPASGNLLAADTAEQ